jgi:hypothetical protein
MIFEEKCLMNKNTQYWFPAKCYGWGWGLPQTWQGWLVMALFAAGQVATFRFAPPKTEPLAFGLSTLLLVAGLIVICFIKGEPPRWRWGKD